MGSGNRSTSGELRLDLPLVGNEASVSKAARTLCEEVTYLFDQLRTPLLRYVLSLGLPAPDAEEIVQEVFLALFRHLSASKSRENLRGWLFRVAHNLALKQRSSLHRDLRRQSDDLTLSHFIAPEPNPEEALKDREKRNRLMAVLRALPEQDRCCLLLRGEGLRYREISAVLGIALGSVSQALTRALAKLSIAEAK